MVEGREKKLHEIAIALLGVVQANRLRLGDAMGVRYLGDLEKRARAAIDAYAIQPEEATPMPRAAPEVSPPRQGRLCRFLEGAITPSDDPNYVWIEGGQGAEHFRAYIPRRGIVFT